MAKTILNTALDAHASRGPLGVTSSTSVVRKFSIALAVVVAAACSTPVDRKPAEQAVQKFHELLDAGQFEAIYEASADDIKRAVGRERFVALLESVHSKLGATKAFVEQRWTVKLQMASALVTLNYATAYSKGEAVEQFVYRLQGDKVLLVGYDIKSNALALR